MLTFHPVIPFQMPPAKESASDLSGTLGSTLPMAAMFTRNKFVGWYAQDTRVGEQMLMKNRASVVLAIQNWLGESAEAKRTSSQPAYFSVGMGSKYRYTYTQYAGTLMANSIF